MGGAAGDAAVVTKEIPLSDFERKAHEKDDGMGGLLLLPLFLLRRAVVKNIEAYRYPEDIEMPIVPPCENPVAYTRHEIEGAYNPVGVSVFAQAGDEKKPLFFFIHGGGFLGGDSRMNEGLLRLVADEANFVSAAVDYNVAPEVRHPVPLEECRRALQFVLDSYPIDEHRIFIAGDSAGGNLTAALTLLLQHEGRPAPRGQIMLYPVCDLAKIDSESYRQKGAEYRGMQKGIKLSRSLYLPDRASRTSPYVSPLCAEFTAPQPDALLLVAERDGLRCDGLAYGEKLAGAGGYSRTVLYRGAYHSFINDLHRSAIADDAAREILAFVEERAGGAGRERK